MFLVLRQRSQSFQSLRVRHQRSSWREKCHPQAIERLHVFLNQQLDLQQSAYSSFDNTCYNNDSPQFPPILDTPPPISTLDSPVDFNPFGSDPWYSSTLNDSTDDFWSADNWTTNDKKPVQTQKIALPRPIVVPEKESLSSPPLQSPTSSFALVKQQMLPEPVAHERSGTPSHHRMRKEDEEYKEESNEDEEPVRRKRGRPVERVVGNED